MGFHLRGHEFRPTNGAGALSRIRTLLGGSVLVCLTACSGPTDMTAPTMGEGPGSATMESLASGGMTPAAMAPSGTKSEATRSGGVALSPAARQVSEIAARYGDRDYLILDKTDGAIIVFERGSPTFRGAALTGENPVDTIPPDAFVKPFSETRGLKYKVTPAGRFTVSSGFDPAYGQTLDVNEIRGKDWDIAIHKVWLGAPAEHRDVRLRTPTGADKHITYGCIDVDGRTMSQILHRVPRGDRTPLYIVPENTALITKLFQPREAARKTNSPSG
jgi:L,D-transpeptidase catalytic domain